MIMKTPNCYQCQWLIKAPAEMSQANVKIEIYYCCAQGNAPCMNVYNSKNCKKLFVEKEIE